MLLDAIAELNQLNTLSDEQLAVLIETKSYQEDLRQAADKVRREHYGSDVYIRGLIEFSNVCAQNCYYCGIRAENANLYRYTLSKEEVLQCCAEGYALGFRTFVLQSGENPAMSDKIICDLVFAIKSAHPDCAVTLSIGEKSRETYQSYKNAGADRYLLRHETANDTHYRQLHPSELSLKSRQDCLFSLKEIGFQVGSGFMVGSPGQTTQHLIEDLRFLQELQPDMIGIGPFLSHRDTPFAQYANGDLALTLRMLSILRLMFPHALLPATTALGTIAEDGRERALQAGANVVMPNLSPKKYRDKYALYDNKIATGEEAAESRAALEKRVVAAGYRIVTAVGHVKK